MPDLLGQGQRLLTPLLGLVRIAQRPEDLREPGEVCSPGAYSFQAWKRGSGNLQGIAESVDSCSRWARAVTNVATKECETDPAAI